MPSDRTPLDLSRVKEDSKKEILKYAVEMRNFEIERFWQRSLFFWGFIGVAFVAYAQLPVKVDPQAAWSCIQFVVSCFGLVCSVAWTLQNRGSKYWQEAWEAKVESVEEEVLGTNLFANREPLQPKGFWGAQTFSVSRLTIALSDFTVLVWVVLVVKAFPHPGLNAPTFEAGTAGVITLTYIGFLLACRQSEHGPTKRKPKAK